MIKLLSANSSILFLFSIPHAYVKRANVKYASSGIYCSQVISERKAERKLKHDDNFNEPMKKKQALLDLLLFISQNGTTILSDDDIREEVNTFMYAGHDTLATSISWTLYALGRYPQYQVRFFMQEIIY